MTAQHKPPYLRRLGFAADPLCFRSKPPLDPSSLILIVGHSMPLDVDQKEEAFPWAGKVAASSLSFSRSDPESYLLERGAQKLSF
ncbi:UNVERIFIED_CONTAM: hypothetical protein Sradi_7280600 [Sesamum radiatum]|uniref:Uncharacterized protein n=1 Tax=Sesamum radiatum TaxID=300843 RepID=A0AAW2IJB1_SESRA